MNLSFTYQSQTYQAIITPVRIQCMGTVANIMIYDVAGRLVANAPDTYIMQGDTFKVLESLMGAPADLPNSFETTYQAPLHMGPVRPSLWH